MEHEVVGKLRARVAAWRHGNPSRHLKLIGIAGAYGKTTTALLLSEILQEAGHSVMTLTNHGCFHNGQLITRRYDTSADALHGCLTVAKKKDIDYVIIEISDALVTTQVLPTVLLHMSIITNDSPSAQALLNQPVDYTVVPSGFDVAGLSVAPHQAISFGEDETAEAQLLSINERRKGTEVELVIDHQTKVEVATYLVGKANALNVATAVSASYVLAVATNTFAEGVARLERVAGNFDYIPAETPYLTTVDAARSEQQLQLVLTSANNLKKRRLLVVADESVASDQYAMLKQLSDRAFVTGTALEVPGLDQADTATAALELAKRAAKKDDLVLLVGRRFAAIDSQGLTEAHRLLKGDDA